MDCLVCSRVCTCHCAMWSCHAVHVAAGQHPNLKVYTPVLWLSCCYAAAVQLYVTLTPVCTAFWADRGIQSPHTCLHGTMH